MYKCFVLFLFCCAVVLSAKSQYVYNAAHVSIVRDSFGVPHIYGKTDADAAYGLAWAHCEDAFKLIQNQLLAARGRLGEVKGKKGAIFDYIYNFFEVKKLVADNYDTSLSADYKLILEAYALSVNDFAKKYPKQVLIKNSFPVTAKDLVAGYTLTNILLGGVGMDLMALSKNVLHEFTHLSTNGSNTLAIAPSRTEDNKAWLLVNSHQPIAGEFAWYEVHINSEEGWNFIGGLFAGGISGFVGCNPALGWAHTTNYHRFGDIYKLQVSKNKKQYFYDNKWVDFGYKTAKLRVKIAGVKIAVKRKIPIAEQGAVFTSKYGYFALRYGAAMDIRAGEQWFRMNKARNFGEFEAAIKMQSLCLFNVNYADTAGNIYFISEGKIPLRDSVKNGQKLDWSLPTNGTSSAYKWTSLLPYESKVKYLNPKAGFLYNCNGSPLFATGYAENSKVNYIGLQVFDFNRNEYYGRVLNDKVGRFAWQEFLDIKYNTCYEKNGSYSRNFDSLFTLDGKKYPKIADAIALFQQWDRCGDKDNVAASIAMLTNYYLAENAKLSFSLLMIQKSLITESQAVRAMTQAKKYLMKRFNRLAVPLGEVQRHARGKLSFAIDGLPEVSRAAEMYYDKKKKYLVMDKGDGYYQLAKFSGAGVELETISPYGASSDPNSRHYSDQMKMFSTHQTKKMSFDKATVLKNALRVYSPNP
jgi:acyl-homoserine-lactone acylase